MHITIQYDILYAVSYTHLAGTGNYKTPVTTDVASVSEDGKTIVYKGTYKENNNICRGDVQKSACLLYTSQDIQYLK